MLTRSSNFQMPILFLFFERRKLWAEEVPDLVIVKCQCCPFVLGKFPFRLIFIQVVMDSFWVFDHDINRAISERCLQLMRINAASARDVVKSDFVRNLPDKYKVNLLALLLVLPFSEFFNLILTLFF